MFTGIQNWITKFSIEIKVLLAIITVAAVSWYGGKNIIYGIKELGSRKGQEAIKSFGYAALIIIIGVIGFVGVVKFIESLSPTTLQ